MYYKIKSVDSKRFMAGSLLVHYQFIISESSKDNLINPKTAAEGVNLTPPPCGFFKIVSTKQRVKPGFFVTFKIIIRDIFPEIY